MREARIKCLTARYQIPSLGLILRKGDEVFVSEDKARQNKELMLALRAGAVRVEFVERYKVKKPANPAPPHVRLSRPGRAPVARPSSPPAPVVEHPEAVAQAAADAARQAVKASLQEDTEDLRSELAEIKVLLRDLIAHGSRVPAADTPKTSSPDEPLFIPDTVVDRSVDLKVAAEESEGENLDDAVAALKATKSGTRRRRTKKTTDVESSDG